MKGCESMDNNNLFVIENEKELMPREERAIPYLIYVLKEMKAQLDQVSSDRSVSIKDKKLLSVEEAAELFGIGRGKIRELTDAEDCPFVIWIGGHRKIKREAFEEYIMKQYSI